MSGEQTVGIVGGVGPLAAAFFYQRLIQLTPATADDEHLRVVLIADRIPSRVDHLLKLTTRSPAPVLRSVAHRLVAAGADVIAVPSATTHAYYRDICDAVDVPVLNLLELVASSLRASGFRRPAILATSATAALRLYDRWFDETIEPLYPDRATQAELATIIDLVKAGAPLSSLQQGIGSIAHRAWAATADVIVLGCTEIPTIAPPDGEVPMLSATDVLAQAVVAEALTPPRRVRTTEAATNGLPRVRVPSL